MAAPEPVKQKLRQAIDRLRDDIDRVEFWADALDRLSQPIPEYQADDHLARHLLSSQRRQDSTQGKRREQPREH